MPYFLVSDFSAGLDLRKSSVTALAGTLRRIKNAHLTPGGEIEKRKAFVPAAPAPPESFGMAVANGITYVFYNSDIKIENRGGEYEAVPLTSNTDDPLVRLVDYDVYDGDLYLVAETSAGDIQHFYPETAGQLDFKFVNSDRAKSRAVRTYRNKIYGVQGKNLIFSAIDDPSDYTQTGSGFINLSTQDADSEDLLGLEVYFDTLAIMSRRAIQIWKVDPDPLLYQQVQVLRSAGTDAPNSLKQFGSGDVLYLAQSGIRSLRSRDSSNSASVSDIGSPIDEYIRDMRRNRSPAYMAKARAIIEPVSGRFWMVFPDEILVLSAFPSPKVTAWSVYYPEFEITDVAVQDDRVVLRGADNQLYHYGEEIYDECETEIITPFMMAEKPATNKLFTGIDVACEGRWRISGRMNPGEPEAEDLLAVVTDTTFTMDNYGMDGISTHIAFRLTTNDSTAARLAHIIVHYQLGDHG